MKTSPAPTGRLASTSVWLPWAVGLIAALFMLSLFVDALHASIERGEAMRRAQAYGDARSAMTRPALASEQLADSTPR